MTEPNAPPVLRNLKRALESDGFKRDARLLLNVDNLALVDDRDVTTLAAAAARIKETEQLTEARLRYALNQKSNSSRGPKAPSWFAERENELAGCLHSAITAAGQLLTALGDRLALDGSMVDVEPGPDGTVVVSLGDGCRWFVAPSRLPWPGCDVRFYAPEYPDSLKLKLEYHRLVGTLIDSTVLHLTRHEHEDLP
jgi:hypothetical protein